jgi:hypothetical protein
VSEQQRAALDQLLRDAPLDLGGDVAEQRVIFEEMMAAIPVPADVTTSSGSLGGGAGRSQVQIPSPRSRKCLQMKAFLARCPSQRFDQGE